MLSAASTLISALVGARHGVRRRVGTARERHGQGRDWAPGWRVARATMVRFLIIAALATLGVAGAPGAGQATPCTTSAQYGTCPYPPYSVNQDMWNPGPGSTQTLTATSAAHWQVSTDQPGGAAVRSYPNVSQNLGQPISDYTTAVAAFAERMPAGAAAEAAFDVWVNGVPTTARSPDMIEVMVWTQNHGNTPAGTKTTTVTIGGQSFTVWECPTSKCVGHPYYAFVLSRNESSGQVHILTTLRWLVQRGLIPASDPLTQVDYGWEVRNTGGATRTFAVTSYRLRTATQSRPTASRNEHPPLFRTPGDQQVRLQALTGLLMLSKTDKRLAEASAQAGIGPWTGRTGC